MTLSLEWYIVGVDTCYVEYCIVNFTKLCIDIVHSCVVIHSSIY